MEHNDNKQSEQSFWRKFAVLSLKLTDFLLIELTDFLLIKISATGAFSSWLKNEGETDLIKLFS